MTQQVSNEALDAMAQLKARLAQAERALEKADVLADAVRDHGCAACDSLAAAYRIERKEGED